MHITSRILLFVTLAAAALGQVSPMIAPRSIVNAASLAPMTFPGGGIAQGSLFSIFGTNLGPSTALSQTNYPLDTQLGGFAVRVIEGTTTLSAIPVVPVLR